MKNLFIFLLLFAITVISCSESPSSIATSENTAVADSEDKKPDQLAVSDPSSLKIKDGVTNYSAVAEKATTDPLQEKHDCKFKGKLLEDNDLWIREKRCLLGIVANEKTKDPNLGDSYRVLEVYDTKNCNLEFEGTLPVNRSPDFPYYFEKKVYKKGDDFVVIRGFDKFYFYNMKDKKLSAPYEPEYKGNPEAADAQSGMIINIKRSGNYLLGIARDFGSFSFDLKEKKARLPAAQYGHNQLFFVPDDDGNFQAVIPVENNQDEGVVLKRLFPGGKNVNPDIPANVANNRYIILNVDPGSTPPRHVAIDMEKGWQIPLPDDIATQSTGEILKWIKEQ